MQTQALIVSEANRIAVGAVEIPPPGRDQVVIQTHFSGISPGTELRKMSGGEGNDFPYVPGYALSGTVVDLGAAVLDLKIGQRVFCTGTRWCTVPRVWGGHIAHAVRPASEVYPLPDHVALAEAALLPLVAIPYHGLRLARPMPGASVAIIGLGPIGQCAARLYAATGARVLGP